MIHYAVVIAVVLAAPSLVLAGEEGGTPYPGDLGQAIASLLIFAGLVVILGKYAWKPILTQLQRREDDIVAKIDDARKRQTEADDLAREYREKLDNISHKVDEMIAEGRKEVEQQRKDILSATHEEASQTLQRAQDDIAAAARSARRELQAETAKLAADLAGQFLSENLTPADQDRIFAQSVQQITLRDAEDAT
jgi:F-type H+-transporting ATPase subunit b